MNAPFLPPTPCAWSISGGLTSGYMLALRLDWGPPRDGEYFIFANTGREREETLVFLHEMETRWGVPLVWVERVARRVGYTHGGDEYLLAPASVRVVDFATAARNGEPFAELITERQYLPNVVTRFCTTELKIRTTLRYLESIGIGDHVKCVGLRADEMRRVASLKETAETAETPLADAGVVKADVAAFWRAQPFTLHLNPWEGNCDLCFLKGQAKLLRIIADEPARAAWWRERERERFGSVQSATRFRKDRPSYERLHQIATTSPMLPFADACAIDDLDTCACTD